MSGVLKMLMTFIIYELIINLRFKFKNYLNTDKNPFKISRIFEVIALIVNVFP